jgi:DNA-binding NtrC family response regulator
MKRSLLIIEQEDTIEKFVSENLDTKEFEIISVDDLSHGVSLLNDLKSIDGVVLDYDLLKSNIKDVIEDIKALNDKLMLLLIGKATTDELINCIKLGADDFIEKPIGDPANVARTIHAFFQRQESETSRIYQHVADAETGTCQMVGQSKAIMDLKKMIYKIAPLDSTVLISGDTGTGKEVVARLIHSLSPQKNHNFVAVHCGGIPDTLLESTLFGHEKGSFTGAYRTHKGYFESANKGTIFLDEIGDTTPSFQVKLLRVLQEKEFRRIGGTDVLKSNARVIAASNRDIKDLVSKGEFREDLYYRLNVITLRVPPLKERLEDIPVLIKHFVNIYSKKHSHLGIYLKPETIDILKRQPWKGNVRELENVIERLIALSDSDWISPSELPEDFLQIKEMSYINDNQFLPYAEAKTLFEREYVRNLLKRTSGNVSQAAKLARMPRQNLHLKIKKHGLRPRNGSVTREVVSENSKD